MKNNIKIFISFILILTLMLTFMTTSVLADTPEGLSAKTEGKSKPSLFSTSALNITKTTGTDIAIIDTDYLENAVITITGAPLESSDWDIIKGLTRKFSLVVNTGTSTVPNSAMTANLFITSLSGNGITDIDNIAFMGCTSLTTIDLPTATTISADAFFGCTSLTTIDLPKATTIGNNAFMNCTSLTTIDLPEATSIGNDAFYNCTSLRSIELPKATTIGAGAFYNCINLTTIDLPEATTIGVSAFMNCTSLRSIELPKVTTIGGRAFYDCTRLTTIDLPKVTSIGSDAFRDCTSLTTIDLPEVTTIGDSAFMGCTRLTTIELPEATTIRVRAFNDCTSLRSIDLPEVTTIGSDAFRDCTSLTTIDLPTATTISADAFFGCTSLTTIELPEATTIGADAFFGCTSLRSIELPKATNIGNHAFNGCINLSTYIFGNTPPTTLGSNIGLNTPGSPTYYYTGADATWSVFTLDSANHPKANITYVSLGTTTVSITPSTSAIEKGKSGTYTVSHKTTTNANVPLDLGTVTWSLSGSQPVMSTVDANGVVTVHANETNKELILTATINIAGLTKTATAEITLTDPPIILPSAYPVKQIPSAENDYTMIVDVDYADFKGVVIDGNTLTKEDFTSWSGSTYVKLSKSYLNTLTTGNHEITIEFTGGTAKTSFTKVATGGGIGSGGGIGPGISSGSGTGFGSMVMPETYLNKTTGGGIGSITQGATNPNTGIADVYSITTIFMILSILSGFYILKKKYKINKF